MSKEIWMDEEVRGYMENYRTALDDVIESTEEQIDWYSRPENHVDGKMRELYNKRDEYEKKRSNLTYRLEDRGFSEQINSRINDIVDEELEKQWRDYNKEMEDMEEKEYEHMKSVYGLDEIQKFMYSMERKYHIINKAYSVMELLSDYNRVKEAIEFCEQVEKRADQERRPDMKDIAFMYKQRLEWVECDIEVRLNGRK